MRRLYQGIIPVLALVYLVTFSDYLPAKSVEPDLPTEGHSLFDRFFSSGGTHHIPETFEALIETINESLAEGDETVGVLVPSGRSRQRLMAFPHFLHHPRVLIAVTGWPKQAIDRSQFGIRLRDRLFIAYSVPAHQLEVISFNDAMGRFEFQIVEDFARPGSHPKVFYAERKQCLKCHQTAGPLFPEPEWDETNASGYLAQALLKIHGHGKDENAKYQGVDIRQPERISYDHDPVGHSEQYDFSTDRALFAIKWQRMWQDHCPQIPELTRQCRLMYLKAWVTDSLNLSDEPLTKELKEITQTAPKLNRLLRTPVRVDIQTNLTNRDPDWAPEITAEVEEKYKKRLGGAFGFPAFINQMMALALPLTTEDSPLTPRPPLWDSLYFDDSGLKRETEVNLNEFLFSPEERKSLLNLCKHSTPKDSTDCPAISGALKASLTNQPSVLDLPYFSVEAVVRALHGLPYSVSEEAQFPEPKLAPLSFATERDLPTEETRLFYQYCARCHASQTGEGPKFLHWERKKDKRSLSAFSDLILNRLKTDSLPLVMPPQDSPEGKQLQLAPEDKGEMIRLMK